MRRSCLIWHVLTYGTEICTTRLVQDWKRFSKVLAIQHEAETGLSQRCAPGVGWLSIFVVAGMKTPGMAGGGGRLQPRGRNRGAPVLPPEKCNLKSVSEEQDTSSLISSQKEQPPSSWHFLTAGVCSQCVLPSCLAFDSSSKNPKF